MIIVYQDPGHGWYPITYMVRLCAELFDSELLIINTGEAIGPWRKLRALAPQRRGSEICLVICDAPHHLDSLMRVEGWRRRFGFIAAWIIDGFRTDIIPRWAGRNRIFDQFFITTDEDVDAWQDFTGCPTSAIPWGADVLRHGTSNPERAIDLLRVGRQPLEWDSDELTDIAARTRGLTFHGRPQILADPIENQVMLMRKYGDSKFVLAFSNTVDGSTYTHPTHPYLTARWTDSLAAGAVMAGIVPKTPTSDRLLWPGATLELGGVSRNEGMEVIASAVTSWRPEQATMNYVMALQRLDWRWRFSAIAATLGQSPRRLATELVELERKITDMTRHQQLSAENT